MFGRREGAGGGMFGKGLLHVGEEEEGIAPQLFTFTPFSKADAAEHRGEGSGAGGSGGGGRSGGSGDAGGSGEGAGFAQAGGHTGTFKAAGPVLEKAVGEREREFYEGAKRGEWPAEFLPRYFGDMGEGRIGLENLVHGMDSPCVLDFKLGTSTVEEDERSLLKKARMSALDYMTKTKSAGVRLEGMSMYRVLEQARIKTSKNQSHVISASIGVTLQDVLTFFLTDESGVRTDVALRFEAHLESLLRYFESQSRFLFIGSSILLVYNNDNRAPHMRWARAIAKTSRLTPDKLVGLTRRTKVDVRMIDFAHTSPLPAGQPRDRGYVTGLHSVLHALRAIRATRARPIFSVGAAVDDAVARRAPSASSPALDAPSPAPLARADSAPERNSDEAPRPPRGGDADHSFNFGVLLQELVKSQER